MYLPADTCMAENREQRRGHLLWTFCSYAVYFHLNICSWCGFSNTNESIWLCDARRRRRWRAFLYLTRKTATMNMTGKQYIHIYANWTIWINSWKLLVPNCIIFVFWMEVVRCSINIAHCSTMSGNKYYTHEHSTTRHVHLNVLLDKAANVPFHCWIISKYKKMDILQSHVSNVYHLNNRNYLS